MSTHPSIYIKPSTLLRMWKLMSHHKDKNRIWTKTELFGMKRKRFDSYINTLIQLGLIERVDTSIELNFPNTTAYRHIKCYKLIGASNG